MTKPYFTYGTSASNRDLVTSTVNYDGKLKRYFSSLDAEIYIGGTRISDIVRIDYSYEEQKLPYYGFNSFMPSRVFVGQKIVKGTFVVNFTEIGYIANLINTVPESVLSNVTDKVGKSCDEYNSANFKRSVDILIGYGGYKVNGEESYNNAAQTIEGVYINGYQQMLDVSGEPIMEVYSFIAKNLSFGVGLTKKISGADSQVSDSDQDSDKTGYEIVEKRLDKEVNALRDKCEKDKKHLGIVVDTYCNQNDGNAKLEVSFSGYNITDKDVFNNVEITISDLNIEVSKTFKLTKVNEKLWTHKLTNKQQIDELNTAFNKNKIINSYLKFDLKKHDRATLEYINKNIGIRKA